jgi:predicted permease
MGSNRGRTQEVIEIVTNVVGPVAVLVLLGALTGPRLNIDAGQLSRLAYWVLGPAFMFDALARAELERSLIARLVVVSVVAMVAAGLAAAIAARSLRLRGTTSGAMIMSSAYGNVGNAGLAISIFALGDAIKPAASVVMLVVNTLGVVLGVGLAGREEGLISALRRALTAPMTLAALAAIAFSYTNTVTTLELPVLADRVISILAGALIPMMLYTLGIQLMNQGKPRLTSDVAAVAMSKLIAAPVAAGLAAGAFGLKGDFASVAVIQSAMPPAVFTAVVAMEHAFEVRRVTTYLVTTSLLALLTLPVVLSFV